MSEYNSTFYSDTRTQTGHLLLGLPDRGKKVFTWKFVMAGTRREILVDVSLINRQGNGEQHPIFTARCDLLKWDGNTYSHTDLGELAKIMEKALLFQVNALSGFAWEDWLEVIVRGSDSGFDSRKYAGMGADLHIQVNKLKRAIHPIENVPVTINSNNCVVRFPKASTFGTETDAGEFKVNRGPEERSYIPDTPANRAALESLAAKMRALRGGLATMLSQTAVQDSLIKIDERLALMSGPSDA